MKTISWIAVFSGLTLAAGCASTPQVTGTEGRSSSTNPVSSQPAVDVATLDTDGDSVIDADDICPDTDELALVDSSGCELRMGPVEGLSFDSNAADLSGNAEQVLDRYIDVLNRYPEITVAVEGHTDNRGPAADNLELSKQRVLSVVLYLVGNGINSD